MVMFAMNTFPRSAYAHSSKQQNKTCLVKIALQPVLSKKKIALKPAANHGRTSIVISDYRGNVDSGHQVHRQEHECDWPITTSRGPIGSRSSPRLAGTPQGTTFYTGSSKNLNPAHHTCFGPYCISFFYVTWYLLCLRRCSSFRR